MEDSCELKLWKLERAIAMNRVRHVNSAEAARWLRVEKGNVHPKYGKLLGEGN